ncbi:hypothetical protein WG66_006235 [Moniliophthora roreri]|uniref:Uncharacterized protein n=1 Tax=Moniliophthora roreri TaxID=221103 RepID=A0A0W0FP43_MONRR|nr:hypothetical protein WG66_006235 [Moniliophthora roreri]
MSLQPQNHRTIGISSYEVLFLPRHGMIWRVSSDRTAGSRQRGAADGQGEAGRGRERDRGHLREAPDRYRRSSSLVVNYSIGCILVAINGHIAHYYRRRRSSYIVYNP